MNWKFVLWFAGMFFAGKIFYSLFGIQYWITKNCAEKLFRMLQNETALWYPEPCRRYLKKLKRIQCALFIVISALVVFFIPLIGLLGYLVGYLLTWITTLGRTGPNATNLQESGAILLKFCKTGRETDFAEALMEASDKLAKNPYVRT